MEAHQNLALYYLSQIVFVVKWENKGKLHGCEEEHSLYITSWQVYNSLSKIIAIGLHQFYPGLKISALNQNQCETNTIPGNKSTVLKL